MDNDPSKDYICLECEFNYDGSVHLESCGICTPIGDDCIECKAGYKMESDLCIEVICNEDEWKHPTIMECLKCSDTLSHCLKCENSYTCTECTSDKFLNPIMHSCGDTCPKGYLQDDIAITCYECA